MTNDLNVFDASDSLFRQSTANFFSTGWVDLHLLFSKAVAAHIISGNSEDQFEHLQDLMFLFAYLVLLDWERMDITDVEGFPPLNIVLYYEYDLGLVREYFNRSYVDINPLITVFF